MERIDCEVRADEIRKKYNPDNLSPFPYQNVEKENEDLNISFFSFVDELKTMSGAISFDEESSKFTIYINQDKPGNRQHFTIAHEIGHYFLHKEIVRSEKLIIDHEFFDGKRALFRLDNAESSRIETEANYFAASLIMPAELVEKAWRELGSVEECASVFNVSVSAMSIRLERLKLL